ncbi:MAG: YqcC family protein [Lonepinella koalarum]|nr:YqcC family protein [Lonepinella koalarum]
MLLRKQTQEQLNELQKLMQTQGLWQSFPPSPEALQSTQPFGLDSLSATEWLQWVFIPRMQALIDSKQPLPTQIAISPYLEEALKEEPYLPALLNPIITIEALLTNQC